MNIEYNKSLVEYTTFGVNVSASSFVQVNTTSELRELFAHELWQQGPRYVLGGGSNILFTQDFDGLVVANNLKGVDIIGETDEYMIVEAASGEQWHDLVLWSAERNLWGIENLALIPGTVGASPVQNIGAYGVEVSEVIHKVYCVNYHTGEQKVFSSDDCNFGYRNSIFKQHPGTYFVTSVQFKLSKIPHINIEYGSIVDKLAEYHITDPSVLDMVETVASIRKSKLPAVGEIGMAGSFFKNPIITPEHLKQLQKKYSEIKYFLLDDGSVKIPAGWIIETLGYKGFREGNVGTYHKHALVLVNHGGATGEEVWEFAQKIINNAQNAFNIILEPEVIIL